MDKMEDGRWKMEDEHEPPSAPTRVPGGAMILFLVFGLVMLEKMGEGEEGEQEVCGLA